MVEHALQREGPVPGCRVERHGEHRCHTCRRRDRGRRHHIGQRNLVGGQVLGRQRRRRGRVERIGQRRVRTRLKQPRHRTGRNRVRTRKVARLRIVINAVRGQAVLVHRAGGGSLLDCARHVIVNRHRNRTGGRDRVAVIVGGLHQRAEVDGQVVFRAARRMVEHALQREGPHAGRGIKAHGEHRRTAGGRRDQVGTHNIAQRNPAREQAGRQRQRRVERIGQRRVCTGLKQARDRARRRQRRTGHIARLCRRDAIGQTVLVHRAERRPFNCDRRVIINAAPAKWKHFAALEFGEAKGGWRQ